MGRFRIIYVFFFALMIAVGCNSKKEDSANKDGISIENSSIINLLNDSLSLNRKPVVLLCDSSEQKLMNTMLQFTYDEFNERGDTSFQFSMLKKIKNTNLRCTDSTFIFEEGIFKSTKEKLNLVDYQSIVISDLIYNKKKNYACFYFAVHDKNDSKGYLAFIKQQSNGWVLYWQRRIWK
jgi:hypothetical protein